MPNAQDLIGKIAALPAERVAEVEDFVDFLMQKDRRQAALGRLLAVAPALQDTGAGPPSDADILGEIDAARTQRRARKEVGDPSASRP